MDDEREIEDTRETFDKGTKSGTSSLVEIEAIEPDMMLAKKKSGLQRKKFPIHKLGRATPVKFKLI